MRKTILIIFLLFCSNTTLASAQLLTEKSRVMLTVDSGETIVDSVTIHNTGKKQTEVKIYWQDFEYKSPFKGDKNFFQPGTLESSMGNWITFSPQLVTLPPHGKRDINFTIKVPNDAKGGYYGVLFFEEVLTGGTSSTGVNIVTRLGSLFFIESVDRNKQSLIDDIKIAGKFITGDFTNLGDVILIPKGVYYLIDPDGLVADRGELDRIYLPPGKKSKFKVYLSDQLQQGNYTLVVTYDLGDGESVVKEIDFTKSQLEQIQINELRD